MFDPNTVEDSLWFNFGLSKKQIAVILNYKKSGAKFKKADDPKKVYSISEELYDSIAPYITIESHSTVSRHATSSNKINLNSCSTYELVQNAGISEQDAQQIVSYRNALGGFVSIEQIYETIEAPDSAIVALAENAILNIKYIKKIDINRDNYIDHPYINNGLSRSIISYREQHGLYSSIEDLKKLSLFRQKDFERLEPYLIVSQID